MSDEQGTAVEPDADGVESSIDGDTAESNDGESAAEPPIEEIADRIETEPSAAIAEEIATLREELAGLRIERDELESRLKRKQAEFQNYKKRQQKQREKQKARATAAIVEDLLDVRDNLSRALAQDESADIRDGVEATFRGLEDVLDGQGVEPIEPEPGTEIDPTRHEVLLRVESDEPEGTVADLHRPGYGMGETVLRTAQVTVSEGPGSGEAETGDEDQGDVSASEAKDE
jgi:molecular chaperone GrpE